MFVLNEFSHCWVKDSIEYDAVGCLNMTLWGAYSANILYVAGLLNSGKKGKGKKEREKEEKRREKRREKERKGFF